MQTQFNRDLADPNRSINEVVAEKPGQVLRLRIQPTILRNGQYQAWKDVRWTLECDTAAEAFAVRDAMRVFFQALSSGGPEAVCKVLGPIVMLTPGMTPGGQEDAA